MDSLLPLFTVSATLVLVLANIALWSRRRLALKVTALAVATAFLPLSYAATADLLSRPKPAQLEWLKRGEDEATLLAAQLEENEAIYLWLKVAEIGEPRAYVLPWSEPMARQIHEAQREAEQNGGNVKVRRPFGPPPIEGEEVVYAPPQPPPPAKETSAGWVQQAQLPDER